MTAADPTPPNYLWPTAHLREFVDYLAEGEADYDGPGARASDLVVVEANSRREAERDARRALAPPTGRPAAGLPMLGPYAFLLGPSPLDCPHGPPRGLISFDDPLLRPILGCVAVPYPDPRYDRLLARLADRLVIAELQSRGMGHPEGVDVEVAIP